MLVGGEATRKGPPAAGTRRGQPRSPRRAAHGGTGPLSGGKRGPGPPWPAGAGWPVMVWPSHVAVPDLPGEAGSAGVTRELSRPRGCAEAPDLTELGEGPETAVPAVRSGGRMPRGPEARGSVDYEKSQGLDTLAGGTLICMYRQRPPGPPRERDEPAGGAKSQHRVGCTARSRQARARMSFRP
jgi:hypothetical protein